MARIPIIEIPKGVPVGSGKLPILESPIPDLYKRPDIAANFPKINVRASIPFAEQGFDIERHIPGLMQSGISEGAQSDIIEGTLAQGKAGGAVAQGIGSALTSIGSAVLGLTQDLQKSKDQADLSRATMLMKMGQAAFEEEVVTKQIPTAQKQALWESKYQPQIEKDLNGLGMSAYSADRAVPEWHLFNIKLRTSLISEARAEQIGNDAAALSADLKDAVETGDFDRAADINARMTLGKHQTPQQQSKRQKDINEAQVEWTIQQDMNANPRMVQQEMEEAEATGKSDIYPSLTNPATISKYKREARNEVNRREVDTDQAISDKILAGAIKSEEDIRREAGGNLSETRIKARTKMLETDPVYNEETVSRLRTEVQAYDAQGDFDMAKYHALTEKISTSVPKDIQGRLNAELYQTAMKARKGEFKDANSKLTSAAEKEIERLVDIGAIKEGKYDPAEAKKDPTGYGYEHREEGAKLWNRVETYKEKLREFMEDEKRSPKEVEEFLNSLISGETTDSSQKALLPGYKRGELKDILPPGAARQQGERSAEEATGMLEPGNINVASRPVVKNKDGTISTLRSITITEDGKTLLIPTIVNGEVVTDAQAFEHYRQTGEHLGIFKDEKSANAYAKKLSTEQGKRYETKPTSSLLNEPFVDRIKELENFAPVAKWDSGQYSVGYGTRGKKGESLTVEEADARLRQELTVHANNVDRAAAAVGLTLTPGQRDALISFDFNTGAAAFLIEDSKGDVAEIRRRMPSWNKEYKGGPVSKGLVKRREAETDMFDA